MERLVEMLRPFIFLILLLAGIGFAVSVLAYLVALSGSDRLDDAFTQFLLPGIFVVWFPTVLIAGRMTRFARQRDWWKIVLSGCPVGMRYTLYGVVAFGFLNFGYFAFIAVPRPIPPALFGGGHLMMFYGAAFCMMYSALGAPKLLLNRKCVAGHDVSPIDTYCPKCGMQLS